MSIAEDNLTFVVDDPGPSDFRGFKTAVQVSVQSDGSIEMPETVVLPDHDERRLPAVVADEMLNVADNIGQSPSRGKNLVARSEETPLNRHDGLRVSLET